MSGKVGPVYVTLGDLKFPVIDFNPRMLVDFNTMIARSLVGFAPPDPRIARDRARAEIDAVIREDARRYPAFATARMAAVMAHIEDHRDDDRERAPLVNVWLASLHRYERERGGLREPSEAARNGWIVGCPMIVHYERNRGAR